MKFFISALLLSFTITSQIFSQTFDSESDLFLNSDESSRAFRFNPAVLGLGHKFNASLDAFYDRHQDGINELNFTAAFGKLGLGYRIIKRGRAERIDVNQPPHNQLSSYSIAFGSGNKNLSFGLGYDHIVNTFYRGSNSKQNIFSLSSIYRPAEYLSLGFAYRTNLFTGYRFTFEPRELILGAGIRPFKKYPVTFLMDAVNNKLQNDFKLSNFHINAGVQAMVIPGLILKGFYIDKSYGIGLGMTFGKMGFSSSSFIHSTRNRNRYNGTSFSLNYTSEMRENIRTVNRNLEVKLSGTVNDYYIAPVFFGILGNEKKSIHQVINEIDDAADNRYVNGMMLYINPFSSGGRYGVTATLEEIGNAVKRFRGRNKKVVAYLAEGSGIEEYYVATFADKIVFPREAIMNYALSIDVMNYREFLRKYGINLEVFAAGKYKLTFQGLQDSVTKEAREVIERTMDVIYDEMLKRVNEGRKINLTEDFKKELSKPLNAHELKDMRLIDEIGWYEDAKDLLKNLTRTGNLYSETDDKWDNSWASPGEIAVIGVFGGITTGESKSPPIINIPLPYLSQGRTTGSQTVIRQLREAFQNRNIKAVILRIDSGGGSALASVEIYDEIKRLKRKYKKPFIVSMGDAAASGGYHVSAFADKIFSGRTTVTGSIGVFFAMPKLDSLMRGQKINIETFKRGEYSAIKSFFEPFTEEEREIIFKQVMVSYNQFIESIAEGRKMTLAQVDEVAQGRVWMGTDALRLKLVDEIGGLYNAVRYAKQKAGIPVNKNVIIKYYPVAGSSMVEEMEGMSFIGKVKKWMQW